MTPELTYILARFWSLSRWTTRNRRPPAPVMTAAFLDLKIPRRRSPRLSSPDGQRCTNWNSYCWRAWFPSRGLPAISAICCALGSGLYRAFSKAFQTCHPIWSGSQTNPPGPPT